MHIALRPALDSDRNFAREVHHRAYEEVVTNQYGPWNETAQEGYFQAAWSSVAHEIILCDETPCGYICLEERPEDMHVRELVIHPDFQNRGIGTHLLRQIMERAEKRQVPVRLGTCHKNRALHFYQKLGFMEFERTNTHILLQWPPPSSNV